MARDGEAHVLVQAGAARSIAHDPLGIVIWRLLAGFGGGYVLMSGLVAAMGSVLPLLGLPRGEAVSLATMLALFVYIPACLLMFASGRPWRDGALVWVGGVALVALATLV